MQDIGRISHAASVSGTPSARAVGFADRAVIRTKTMEQNVTRTKGRESDGSSSSTGDSNEDKHRVSWIMAIAAFLSTRSPDPKRQVGAVLVDSKGRLVGQGYNGMVKGASARDFPLEADKNNPFQNKNNFVCHAEMNALFFSQTAELEGSKLYQTTHPCNECAKNIAPTAIKEIFVIDFQKTKEKSDVSREMLTNKVKPWKLKAVRTLDFGDCTFKDGCNDNTLVSISTGSQSTFCVKSTGTKGFTWTDYFFSACVLESMMNKSIKKEEIRCNAKQGVCIVDKANCIIACASNDLPDVNNQEVVRHAVITAILQARRQADGAALYALAYPCNECAKAVVQSGIKSLTYLKKPSDSVEYQLAERIFLPKLEHREIAIRHESTSDGAKFSVEFGIESGARAPEQEVGPPLSHGHATAP